MELLLIGLLLWIIWVVIPRREKYENNSHPDMNVPLHYIYAVDEWEKLRRQFDQEIEPVWQKYRFNDISPLDYQLACIKAVDKIIGKENRQKGFDTFFKWGIRNAAIRMAREGYAPGKADAILTLAELKRWVPETWNIPGWKMNRWNECNIGTKGFMDLYPDASALERAGVGQRDWKTGIWSPRTTSRYPGSYREYFGLGYATSPQKVEQYLVRRGYNGKTYTNERTRGDGLCDAERIKKYEFVAKQ